jgi:hypothetical protein
VAIPPLILKIIADSTGVKKGVAETNAQMGGLQKTTSGISTAMTAGLAVAGIAAVKFGVDSVKAFMEAQAVMAQTEAVLKSTGAQAGVTADDVLNLASKWQQVTGIQDDAIQSSSNLLLTFRDVRNEVGKGNDVFNQAQAAILDMSTALNRGAIPSADQLQSSTIQLGKALNDPIAGMTALKRVGVSFNESQIATIKRLQESGDLMGAQKIILAELTAEFGGAAKAAGDTFAGQVAKLQANLNNLQEEIGSVLVPRLNLLAEVMNDIAQKKMPEASKGVSLFREGLSDLASVGGSLSGSVIGWAGQLSPVIDLWNKFGDDQKETSEEISHTTGVVGKLGDQFAELGARMPKVAKAFRDTRDALLEEIPALRGTADTFKDTFTLKPQELVHITASWAKIAKTIASDLRAIADSDLKPKMREAIAALPPEMRDAWVQGSAKQRGAIEKSIQTTFNVQDQMPKLARDALSGGITVGVSLTQGVVRGIVSGSPAVDAAARAAVLKAIAAARDAAQAQSPSKKMEVLGIDFMQGLINGVSRMVSTFDDVVGRSIERSVSRFSHDLDQLKTRISGWRSDIQSGFRGFDLIGGLTGLQEGEDPAAFLRQQLVAAQQFGAALTGLQAGGLHGNLLTQIASQGPQALPLAQTLLSDPELLRQLNQTSAGIQRIAESTRREVIHEEFGGAIDRLGDRLERVVNRLPNINIHINGWVGRDQELAEKIRDELLKLKGSKVNLGLS